MNHPRFHRLSRRLALALAVAAPVLPLLAQGGALPAVPNLARTGSYGIVALNNTNSIRIINTGNWTISEPMLTGQLGSFGGGLFDVVVTPDGRTALVSNFGDSQVHFLDMSNPTLPTVKGVYDVGFFAEDMDITPDGKYALVTDGGFSPKIAVINIAERSGQTYYFSFSGNGDTQDQAISCQAVSIMADGETVLCPNYFSGTLHVFRLHADGSIAHTQTLPLPLKYPVAPEDLRTLPAIPGPMPNRSVNVAVSPDGIHAAVLGFSVANNPADPFRSGPTVFLYKRVAPGELVALGDNGVEFSGRNAQSAVFSPDGKRLYVSATNVIYPPPIVPPPPATPPPTTQTWVRIFNVVGDAVVLDTDVELPGRGSSGLFGVDTIAVDQSGQFVFLTNPTVSGGLARIDVVSAITKSYYRSFVLPDQTYTNYYLYLPEHLRPAPLTETKPPIPTGIAFTRGPRITR